MDFIPTDMTPRQTPLCVDHFIEFVRKYQIDCEGTDAQSIKIVEKAERKAVPLRRQPKRAARTEKSYADTPTRKRKADPNTEPRPTKRNKVEISSEELRCKINKIITGLAEKITVESGCPFGFKPWVCETCSQEDKTQKLGTFNVYSKDRGEQEQAVMTRDRAKRDTESSILLDWDDIAVPEDHLFQVGDKTFAADVCGKTMILML